MGSLPTEWGVSFWPTWKLGNGKPAKPCDRTLIFNPKTSMYTHQLCFKTVSACHLSRSLHWNGGGWSKTSQVGRQIPGLVLRDDEWPWRIAWCKVLDWEENVVKLLLHKDSVLIHRSSQKFGTKYTLTALDGWWLGIYHVDEAFLGCASLRGPIDRVFSWTWGPGGSCCHSFWRPRRVLCAVLQHWDDVKKDHGIM